MKKLYVASRALLMVAIVNLAFLLTNTAQNQAVALVTSLALSAIAAPVAILAFFAFRRLRRRRTRILRRFYRAGLRIDTRGRLITDQPRPRIVRDAHDNRPTLGGSGGRGLASTG